ncbi:hypothetical protein N7448_003146 [Penicillium atrosanguineum]|nr:hypothetical protein N7448_003146 [Penicillium atrosanguineum]
MGKKRRGPSLDELMARPWCYYCERDFDDLKILTLHQKAKHFKCDKCGRRLNTAGGLSVHMSQVHKEQLTEIENALPNRAGLDVEIFGMEGVPDDVLHAHQQRVAAQFAQAEAERQAATGNPPSGSVGGQPAKKPKLEDMSEMKRRLAEHRAKKAEAAGGGSSGSATPASSGPPAPQATKTEDAYVRTTPPLHLRLFLHLWLRNHILTPPPYGGAPATPYQQIASPVYQTFSPVSGQVPGAVAPYPPAGYPPQMPGYPPALAYGAPPFPQHPISADSTPPPRPGSLPTPSGLPQRPAFGAPTVNAQQLQQMHMGHAVPPAPGHGNGDATGEVSSSVKDLISDAANEATEKPAKKDKSKATRMIYLHDTMSPEEKMSQLPRYAVDRKQFPQETVLDNGPDATVVGTIRDSDTVLDPAQ